jgi:hypothetical protein
LNWLSDLSWLVGPALQVALLTVMVRRDLHVTFPRFFSYVIFQTIKSGILFVVYRYSPENYFDAYWTGSALSVLLTIAVMDEILHSLFEEYGGIQNLGATIFRWACGLLLLLAVVGAFNSQDGGSDRIVAGVLEFDRSVRLMECGLFVLLMLLCRSFRGGWRQRAFGIALGFGIFASVEVILVSLVMRYGDGPPGLVSVIKSVAYNMVTVLWIFYARQQQQQRSPAESRAIVPLRTANVAFGMPGGTSNYDENLLTMVERVAEQLLSRGSWPRPSTRGSRIVGRRPESQDRN